MNRFTHTHTHTATKLAAATVPVGSYVLTSAAFAAPPSVTISYFEHSVIWGAQSESHAANLDRRPLQPVIDDDAHQFGQCARLIGGAPNGRGMGADESIEPEAEFAPM